MCVCDYTYIIIILYIHNKHDVCVCVCVGVYIYKNNMRVYMCLHVNSCVCAFMCSIMCWCLSFMHGPQFENLLIVSMQLQLW